MSVPAYYATGGWMSDDGGYCGSITCRFLTLIHGFEGQAKWQRYGFLLVERGLCRGVYGGGQSSTWGLYFMRSGTEAAIPFLNGAHNSYAPSQGHDREATDLSLS